MLDSHYLVHLIDEETLVKIFNRVRVEFRKLYGILAFYKIICKITKMQSGLNCYYTLFSSVIDQTATSVITFHSVDD